MSEILIIAALWIVTGVAGSMMVLEFQYRRGSIPMDVTVKDLLHGAFAAIWGPINLLVGICFFTGWVCRRLAKGMNINGRRVVFKAKDS